MTYTREQVTNAIRYAVAKRGRNFINYETDERTGACQYIYEGPYDDEPRPSCIIGVALNYLGFSHDELSQHEGDTVDMFGQGYVDDDVLFALRSAQKVQDNEKPWGQALTAFNSSFTHPKN